MDQKIKKAVELAEDLQRMTLHGNPPLETTMALVEGVLAFVASANEGAPCAIGEHIIRADALEKELERYGSARSVTAEISAILDEHSRDMVAMAREIIHLRKRDQAYRDNVKAVTEEESAKAKFRAGVNDETE